ASVAAVVFVFLFEACFTWGSMATVWIHPAEILPLKSRAKRASQAGVADFLGNFLVVEVTPPGIRNIGWRFYIVWAVLNVVNSAVVFCFYPETGGLPLEAVDRLFVEEKE
ncbi:general substrate transporter, partial [Lepidopterella palustris CBS 459.81]